MASLAPFVVRRGAVYHIRCRIPLDLVAVVGRPEYKRSLKTSCPKVARRRAAKARGRLAEVFEEIRRMRNPKEEQIQSLLDMVAEWEGIEDMRRRADAMRTETTGLQAAVAELKELERVGGEISRFSERWRPEIARLAADRNAAKESAPLFPALRECLSAFRRENDNAGSGGEAVELGLQLQSLATELQQAEDAVASKDAVIEEKERQLGVQMGTLGAMLANLGIPNRNVHTETVTAYLHTHYLEKKKLRDDAKRHIVGYVTLFAKLTGDRQLAEYNAGEIVSYVRLLEQVKNTYAAAALAEATTVDRQGVGDAGGNEDLRGVGHGAVVVVREEHPTFGNDLVTRVQLLQALGALGRRHEQGRIEVAVDEVVEPGGLRHGRGREVATDALVADRVEGVLGQTLAVGDAAGQVLGEVLADSHGVHALAAHRQPHDLGAAPARAAFRVRLVARNPMATERSGTAA